jgi:hypothetical protein
MHKLSTIFTEVFDLFVNTKGFLPGSTTNKNLNYGKVPHNQFTGYPHSVLLS